MLQEGAVSSACLGKDGVFVSKTATIWSNFSLMASVRLYATHINAIFDKHNRIPPSGAHLDGAEMQLFLKQTAKVLFMFPFDILGTNIFNLCTMFVCVYIYYCCYYCYYCYYYYHHSRLRSKCHKVTNLK